MNVTEFLSDGELGIATFAGTDAATELNTIHPPDVIDKLATAADELVLSVTEVLPEHWCGSMVGESGQVVDVTELLPEYIGGELGIATFAGTDAAKEVNTIHPPDRMSLTSIGLMRTSWS